MCMAGCRPGRECAREASRAHAAGRLPIVRNGTPTITSRLRAADGAPGPRARRAPFPDPLSRAGEPCRRPLPRWKCRRRSTWRCTGARSRPSGPSGGRSPRSTSRRRTRVSRCRTSPRSRRRRACTCRPRSRPRWSIRAPWSRSTTASSRGCAGCGRPPARPPIRRARARRRFPRWSRRRPAIGAFPRRSGPSCRTSRC